MANPNPFFQYTVGLNNVGSYQASARPWIKSGVPVPVSGATSNATEIVFPNVTRFVTIRNDCTGSNSKIRVAFSRDALLETKNNFFRLCIPFKLTSIKLTREYLAEIQPLSIS